MSRIFELARAEQEGWNLPRAVGALINQNAPAELVAICEKAMAREKPARYQ